MRGALVMRTMIAGVLITGGFGVFAARAETQPPPLPSAKSAALTSARCPAPKDGEVYEKQKPGRWNEARNGGIVTITNLYGTRCTKEIKSVRGNGKTFQVRGVCTGPGDSCTCDTYTDPDGKIRSCKDIGNPVATNVYRSESTPDDSGSKTVIPDAPKQKNAGTSALDAALNPQKISEQKTPLSPASTDKAAQDGLFSPDPIREQTKMTPAETPPESQPQRVDAERLAGDADRLVPSYPSADSFKPPRLSARDAIAQQSTFQQPDNAPSTAGQSSPSWWDRTKQWWTDNVSTPFYSPRKTNPSVFA